ncbi:MAG: hypothetical protein IPN39_12695 [Chitinophagaceae bacterium]|nr:hypothetical protein [Chitinophagaceae bacterium]
MSLQNILKFKLKQHTPLIHFQPNQEGATLRATEVKPKLDRYLLEMVFQNDFEKAKTYFIGYTKETEKSLKAKYEKGYNAFDYKLTVYANQNSIINEPIPDRFPCFFGNMGVENISNPKMFSFSTEVIELTCKTNHRNLRDELIKEIPNFLARNNFGNRQSKGFGSFFIDEGDEKFQTPGLYSYFLTQPDNKQYHKISDKYKPLFKDIEMIHKVFRSGINDIGPGQVNLFYMKPLMWEYFKQKGIAWEKRRIKEQFYSNILEEQISKREMDFSDTNEADKWPLFYKGRKYNILRDLLGLSSLENWRIPYNDTITKKSKEIDRMKSPLFYKPIVLNGQSRVYLDFDYIPKDFLGSEFIISKGSSEFPLKVAEEFDIDDFFEWSLTRADIKTLIAIPHRETRKAKQILGIFRELRKNINY